MVPDREAVAVVGPQSLLHVVVGEVVLDHHVSVLTANVAGGVERVVAGGRAVIADVGTAGAAQLDAGERAGSASPVHRGVDDPDRIATCDVDLVIGNRVSAVAVHGAAVHDAV